jgi:ribose 5-phosphate isomerase B
MSIFANKYKDVRAALCTDSYMAKMTRAHNDSNVLCLGGKITGLSVILDIVGLWLGGVYEGGRHDIALDMIRESENHMMNGDYWLSDDPRI